MAARKWTKKNHDRLTAADDLLRDVREFVDVNPRRGDEPVDDITRQEVWFALKVISLFIKQGEIGSVRLRQMLMELHPSEGVRITFEQLAQGAGQVRAGLKPILDGWPSREQGLRSSRSEVTATIRRNRNGQDSSAETL